MAEIQVQMYNVGFGDCFLLKFPRDGRTPFRVLVDCGSHSAGHPRPGWKIRQTVAAIVDDIGDDGSVIDVVVATHRHQDHVSGFAEPAWSSVTVGEVWLPWTEDPDDPEATRIRTRQSSLALNLTNAFTDPGFVDRWKSEEIAPASLQAMVANSLTNEGAMRTLHRGFAGKPTRRFLSTDTGHLQPDDCPGLTVHVLGPSKDESVIRDMDPPPEQSYLAFGAAPPVSGPVDRTPSPVSESNRPFAKSYVLDEAAYGPGKLGGSLKSKAAAMMRDTDLATVVSLDKAVNGTSLMLMFEFGSAYLLFPGDAQWGTWHAAMNRPASRQLLTRTTFYKVGHHGSHNATPRAFLEEVLDGNPQLWASAASVRPISFWPNIPRTLLMDELNARCKRVLRSDQDEHDSPPDVTALPGKAGLSLQVPS